MADGQNRFIKAYKALRWFLLAGSLVVLFLAFKSPADPGPKLDRATQNEQAQAFQEKETAATLTNTTESKPANNPSSEQVGDGQVKDVRVEFSNDVVTGYFTTQQYGKEIHLTVAGRLGCKDGYATFDPTAFKIGDLSVPVSFVNPALQKKLADPLTREKLKLPEFVADLRIV